MLQIRLNKGSSLDGGSVAKSLPVETVTVACPDHLVIADLPVAKGLGSATSASRLKIVGRRSRRQLGERVHFCVRCDFPIAVYGRLSPCEHVFCLDCARSDSICYLCDDRIQKIQTIKMMEGIFICAAPHCLKSFVKKAEFESHIHGAHSDLLHPSFRKDAANRSDAFSIKQTTTSESSVRAPPLRPSFPPASPNPQLNDPQDRARHQQSREQTPLRPPMQPRAPSYYSQNPNPQPDLVEDSGIHRSEGLGPQGRTPSQKNFDLLSDKQQQEGILSDSPHYLTPIYYQQPPKNLSAPMNPNPVLTTPPFFGVPPPLPSDGAPPPFYGGPPMPYDITRSDSAPELGSSEQSSFLGFPQGGSGGPPSGFSEVYPHSWSAGPSSGVPFEALQAGQGMNVVLDRLQGDTGRNSLPLNPLAVPVSSHKATEQSQGGNAVDAKGILPSMPPPPPPGPPPLHILQQKLGNYISGDDGMKYGWAQEKRDNFGSS